MDGAVISAASLDGGIKEYFHNDAEEPSEEESVENNDEKGDVKYGNVVIKSLLWQDDLLNVSKSIKEAQIAHEKWKRCL